MPAWGMFVDAERRRFGALAGIEPALLAELDFEFCFALFLLFLFDDAAFLRY